MQLTTTSPLDIVDKLNHSKMDTPNFELDLVEARRDRAELDEGGDESDDDFQNPEDVKVPTKRHNRETRKKQSLIRTKRCRYADATIFHFLSTLHGFSSNYYKVSTCRPRPILLPLRSSTATRNLNQ